MKGFRLGDHGPLVVLLGSFLPVLLCIVGNVGQAKGQEQRLPDFPAPACLGDRLKQTEAGFFVEDKRLSLDAVLPLQTAAAFYGKEGLLITVAKDGTVVLYGMQDGTLAEKTRKAVGANTRTEIVHFTRVPGLLYVFWIDTKEQARLREGRGNRQTDPYRFSRVALTAEADKWDAMPDREREGQCLSGCYLLTSEKSVPFSLKEGTWGVLQLGEPLAEPSRSGPVDSLAQCVFVFPEKAIVCRTRNGWSVNKLNGALVKYFFTKEIEDREYVNWWGKPTLEKDCFVVHGRTGPHSLNYILDTETGKLQEKEQ